MRKWLLVSILLTVPTSLACAAGLDLDCAENGTVGWNGGSGIECPPLPARATTWGQVKSFYR